jgi:YhcH/YjgK/YiaL family protein
MVYDRIEHADRYAGLHARFARAFEILRRPATTALPAGRHEIDGEAMYLVIVRADGVGKEQAKLEAHRRYIDIQYTMEGMDTMGWKPLSDCNSVSDPYDDAKDITFFADAPAAWAPVAPGMFTIFFPDDAHAPMVGTGMIHKAVMKVRVIL